MAFPRPLPNTPGSPELQQIVQIPQPSISDVLKAVQTLQTNVKQISQNQQALLNNIVTLTKATDVNVINAAEWLFAWINANCVLTINACMTMTGKFPPGFVSAPVTSGQGDGPGSAPLWR